MSQLTKKNVNLDRDSGGTGWRVYKYNLMEIYGFQLDLNAQLTGNPIYYYATKIFFIIYHFQSQSGQFRCLNLNNVPLFNQESMLNKMRVTSPSNFGRF